MQFKIEIIISKALPALVQPSMGCFFVVVVFCVLSELPVLLPCSVLFVPGADFLESFYISNLSGATMFLCTFVNNTGQKS